MTLCLQAYCIIVLYKFVTRKTMCIVIAFFKYYFEIKFTVHV